MGFKLYLKKGSLTTKLIQQIDYGVKTACRPVTQHALELTEIFQSGEIER